MVKLSRPLLSCLLLGASSACGGPGVTGVSGPATVPGFYRLSVFLDSSLPKVPDRLVSGDNALWQLSSFRNSGIEWWICQNPGNPTKTSAEECLANSRSWGSETAWWNNVPPPQIQRTSGFQIFLFNSSRDPLLERASAKLRLRFTTTDGRGRLLEANPLNSPTDFMLDPFPASYGGIDSQAWAAPSKADFFRLEKVGRYDLRVRFEPQGDGPSFFLASVIEVVP